MVGEITIFITLTTKFPRKKVTVRKAFTKRFCQFVLLEMALDINRRGEQTGLLAGNMASRQVRIGDVEVGQAQYQTVNIQSKGQLVNVRDALHAETNFYIRQSRQYFPSHRLRTFAECRCFKSCVTFMCTFSLALLIAASCLIGVCGYDATAISVSIGLSALAVVCCTPVLLIFCQHLRVICCTLPVVLSQHAEPNLGDKKNDHIEVGINTLERAYVRANGKGVNFLSQNTGKIQIQVLSYEAVWKIKCASICSICCCLSIVIVALWAPTMLVLSTVRFTSLK